MIRRKRFMENEHSYTEKDWDDPRSWTYISQYPVLIKFGENLGERKLELLNNVLICLHNAMDSLDNADSASDLREFKYLLSHSDVLSKCWNALKRNGNW